MEDSAAVVKKAQLGKALSIATGVMQHDNRAKLDLKTRPNWFLGSEDESNVRSNYYYYFFFNPNLKSVNFIKRIKMSISELVIFSKRNGVFMKESK